MDLVEISFKGQVCHTDYAVHGRSDFVAHVGQKLTFGAVGGLGMAGGPAQRKLHLGAIGDIDNVGHQAGDFARRIGDWRLAKQALTRLAGRTVDKAGLKGLGHAGLEQLPVPFRVHHQDIIAAQLSRTSAHPLRSIDPQQLFKGPIHANEAPAAVFQVQGGRCRFKQHLNKTQLIFKLGFDRLALGNVGPNGDVLLRPTRGPKQRHDGGTDPIVTPILMPVLDVATPDLALLNGLPQVLEKRRRVVAAVDDPVVKAQQLLPREPADVAEPIIGVGDVALGVGDADNGMLIEREFLVGQFKPSLLALTHQSHHLVHQCVKIVRRRR